MPIPEADISILIPTFMYRDKVGRAVASALASGAGEIVVTDDRSRDGTMEFLAGFADPRLKVIENPRKLGLWENHLAALGHATRPWIKFVQADDYLLAGGLARYAAAVGQGVTLVWSCAVVRDDETGQEMRYHDLAMPRRVTGQTILDACVVAGWILGSPSHMMVRSDVIPRDPAAWRTEISADVVLGAVAVSKGDVVLLPPGAIGHGVHPLQDAKTQGCRRGLRRLVATPEYLRQRPEPLLGRFAAGWAARNQSRARHIAAKGLLEGQIQLREAARLLRRNHLMSRQAPKSPASHYVARACRAGSRSPVDLDALLDRLSADLLALHASTGRTPEEAILDRPVPAWLRRFSRHGG
jgi:hypothetical protein